MKLNSIEDVENIFPKTKEEITILVDDTIIHVKKEVESICNKKTSDRTLDNTVLAFDRLQLKIDVVTNLLGALRTLTDNSNLSNYAGKENSRLINTIIDLIDENHCIYNSFISYLEENPHEKRNDIENYFIRDSINDWLYSGFDLSHDAQENLKHIKNQLSFYTSQFRTNIIKDAHSIYITKTDMPNVSASYLKGLNQPKPGVYSLKADTYIQENCTLESTRKDFWKLSVNIAYPINQDILMHIISLRDKLARQLGFSSFAQLDISNQMAKTPEQVQDFVSKIIKKCQNKINLELEIIKSNLPKDIKLSTKDKIKPWDFLYIKNNYKKNILKIDELEISNYFPLDHTLQALIKLIEQLFSVELKPVTSKNLWDNIKVLEVHKDNNLRGFIILDLLKRPNKYAFMLEQTIIPSLKTQYGFTKGVTLIMGSFMLPYNNKPTLLKRSNVMSLFHEFGHALHSILGAQEIASLSGSRVKKDFVEMPSQMLEQWVWEPDVLKLVSSNYKTGEQLPERIIEKIVKLKNLEAPDTLLEQCFYAMESLTFFEPGEHKDIFSIHKRLFEEILTHIEFNNEDHSYASFDHLTGYGAKYYSYLWAKIFAVDLFEYIKQQQATNHDLKSIGQKYIEEIISPGGSQEPVTLLKNFLHRNPSIEVFFKALNIDK